MEKTFTETIAYRYGAFVGFLIFIAYGYLLICRALIGPNQSGMAIITGLFALFTIPFYIIGCIIQIVELAKKKVLPKLSINTRKTKLVLALYIIYSIVLPAAFVIFSIPTLLVPFAALPTLLFLLPFLALMFITINILCQQKTK